MRYHPVERQTQTDANTPRSSIDGTSDPPFQGRRRSSVRFEDEARLVTVTQPSLVVVKVGSASSTADDEIKQDEPVKVEEDLHRAVSFRNNEDDLWTTITINAEGSIPTQSSHFNRLSLENLSIIDTCIQNGETGITAIHVNSRSVRTLSADPSEAMISSTDLPLPISPVASPFTPKRYRTMASVGHCEPAPTLLPHAHAMVHDDDTDLRHIKPVEEINAIVADKFNYDNLSQALKSNVQRLKNTFVQAHENQPHYDRPRNLRMFAATPSSSSITTDASSRTSEVRHRASDC